MKTTLVTGGAGFIGANFVLDWLGQTDEPVLNLDKLTYAGNPENLITALRDNGAKNITIISNNWCCNCFCNLRVSLLSVCRACTCCTRS